MTQNSTETALAPEPPTPLELDLAALPKVSLHDHLDGGLRPDTVAELAAEIGHELPVDPTTESLAEWFAEAANAGTLEQYLETFAHTTAVMQTAPALTRIAREFVEDLVEDGVVYAEIRWAPEQHTEAGLSLDEAVEAVQAGLDAGVEEAAERGRRIQVGQLVTAMRQNDRSQEIAELAVRHRDRGVVGFDIAGPESGFPPSRFTEAFTWLAEQNFPVTVHAGESEGLDSIRDALVNGRALRLGHGVRIADDLTVTDAAGESGTDLVVDLGHLANWVLDREIPLEICPSSNLQTGAVPGPEDDSAPLLAQHPIDMLVQLGFSVTVNPDNRLVSGVSLTDELYLLAETYDYSLADLLQFQINAAKAAFLDHDARYELLEYLLDTWSSVAEAETTQPGSTGLRLVEIELDDE
ncbi:MAG: adenosine deaminase [Micrococcaceae bacterium]